MVSKNPKKNLKMVCNDQQRVEEQNIQKDKGKKKKISIREKKGAEKGAHHKNEYIKTQKEKMINIYKLK